MTQSIADTNPNGFCKKCGFHLQNGANKTLTCVNCDIKSEPSGVVNSIEDPGHAAMKSILAGVVKPDMVKEIPLKESPQSDAAGIGVAKTYKPTTQTIEIGTALQIIQDHLAAIPIQDLTQAKTLLKLRKQTQTLADKIQNFLGGK